MFSEMLMVMEDGNIKKLSAKILLCAILGPTPRHSSIHSNETRPPVE